MFQKQPIMRKVVYSLLPLFLYSVYLYGWRSVLITGIVFLAGTLTEYIMEKRKNKKVSEAVFVTNLLFALSLPPGIPFTHLWIPVVGIVFAVLFAKEAFGGFGRNIFNPAITGRLFIYLSFTLIMQTTWMVPGNFGSGGIFGIDGVSGATPLDMIFNGNGANLNITDMFFGFRAGAMGESAIFLILGAAVYLIATKTANWKLMFSTIAGALLTFIPVYLAGAVPGMPAQSGLAAFIDIAKYLMSGSLIFVTVFMVTDPVTGPNKPASQWIYGLMIGAITILIRVFNTGIPEATSFAVIIGNTFASLLDEYLPAKKKKAVKAA